jgi:hypothetical protein
MKTNKRAIFGLSALALILVALTVALGSRTYAPSAVVQPVDEPVTAPTSIAESSAPRKVAHAKAGAAGAPAPVVAQHIDKSLSPECQSCRKTQCTNYKGLGVDIMSGCFDKVDTSLGAEEGDHAFNSDCAAAVACASRAGCADPVLGAFTCYCGSRTVDDCVEHGPSADAPCAEEWRRATRTTNHTQLTERFSILQYPSGWATFMIECDQTECKSQCG